MMLHFFKIINIFAFEKLESADSFHATSEVITFCLIKHYFNIYHRKVFRKSVLYICMGIHDKKEYLKYKLNFYVFLAYDRRISEMMIDEISLNTMPNF